MYRVYITAKNTVISPDFLVWEFCGKAQFLHSFGRFAPNYGKLCTFAIPKFEYNRNKNSFVQVLSKMKKATLCYVKNR